MISQLLWLLVPAMIANMAPVFAARYHLFPRLNVPLDGGRIWHGARILGDNKTVRGLVVGVVSASLVALLQSALGFIIPLNDSTPLGSAPTALLFGTVVGAAALLGDAFKSFLKRRINIRPGHSWPVFDQIDFVVAALVVITFFVPVNFSEIIFVTIIIGVASALTSIIGVWLRIKKSL